MVLCLVLPVLPPPGNADRFRAVRTEAAAALPVRQAVKQSVKMSHVSAGKLLKKNWRSMEAVQRIVDRTAREGGGEAVAP